MRADPTPRMPRLRSMAASPTRCGDRRYNRLPPRPATPHGEGRMTPVRYDTLGRGYTRTRHEDPGFRSRILHHLGDARTVVNVGAGAGAYEPDDRYVLAIEPSDVMAAQRPPGRAPA